MERQTWAKIHKEVSGMGVDNILHLVDLLQSLPPTSVANEATFSQLKYVKNDRRARLSPTNLDNLLLIRIEGPTIQDFNPEEAIDLFLVSIKMYLDLFILSLSSFCKIQVI